MPRAVVVLPSTSYRAHDFVSAAESLGIDLVVASEQPPPFDMGDRYLEIDCSDPQLAAEQVAALGDDVPLDGLVAADDGGVVVVALAGNALGLRANPADAASATRNKHLMRDRLAAAEVPQPDYGRRHRRDRKPCWIPSSPQTAGSLGQPRRNPCRYAEDSLDFCGARQRDHQR